MRRLLKIVILFNMCIISSFSIFIKTAYALEPSSDVIYQGIDVSVYQGNINYARS